MTYSGDIDPGDANELIAEDRERRRHNRALARHPDCRDPDHPGCDICEPEEEDEDDE